MPPSRCGDFAELYLKHYSRLVRALIIAGSDPVTAQDLAQEAFARTFQHWRRVRTGPNPAGYIHTIAFRLLHRRRPVTETPLDDVSLPPVSPADEEAVAVETVRDVLAHMAPRQRACVALCVYLGHSADETAELLGISPSTVRVQLHRARQRLRSLAGDDFSLRTHRKPGTHHVVDDGWDPSVRQPEELRIDVQARQSGGDGPAGGALQSGLPALRPHDRPGPRPARAAVGGPAPLLVSALGLLNVATIYLAIPLWRPAERPEG